MKLFALGIPLVGVWLSSCSSTQKIPLSPSEGVKAEKVVHVYGEELVSKKTKYSVRSYVNNLSNKSLIIRLAEIQCYRGSERGITGHATFGIGERVINFAPGQQKRFNFLCDFGKREPKGPYKIIFTKVYENTNGDAVTVGKVLKENLVWNVRSDIGKSK